MASVEDRVRACVLEELGSAATAHSGHVARLAEHRLVRILQWDASLPTWRTRKFLFGNIGGPGHPRRHRGWGARRSPWEQAPHKLFDASVVGRTEGLVAAWRHVHMSLSHPTLLGDYGAQRALGRAASSGGAGSAAHGPRALVESGRPSLETLCGLRSARARRSVV